MKKSLQPISQKEMRRHMYADCISMIMEQF